MVRVVSSSLFAKRHDTIAIHLWPATSFKGRVVFVRTYLCQAPCNALSWEPNPNAKHKFALNASFEHVEIISDNPDFASQPTIVRVGRPVTEWANRKICPTYHKKAEQQNRKSDILRDWPFYHFATFNWNNRYVPTAEPSPNWLTDWLPLPTAATHPTQSYL